MYSFDSVAWQSISQRDEDLRMDGNSELGVNGTDRKGVGWTVSGSDRMEYRVEASPCLSLDLDLDEGNRPRLCPRAEWKRNQKMDFPASRNDTSLCFCGIFSVGLIDVTIWVIFSVCICEHSAKKLPAYIIQHMDATSRKHELCCCSTWSKSND